MIDAIKNLTKPELVKYANLLGIKTQIVKEKNGTLRTKSEILSEVLEKIRQETGECPNDAGLCKHQPTSSNADGFIKHERVESTNVMASCSAQKNKIAPSLSVSDNSDCGPDLSGADRVRKTAVSLQILPRYSGGRSKRGIQDRVADSVRGQIPLTTFVKKPQEDGHVLNGNASIHEIRSDAAENGKLSLSKRWKRGVLESADELVRVESITDHNCIDDRNSRAQFNMLSDSSVLQDDRWKRKKLALRPLWTRHKVRDRTKPFPCLTRSERERVKKKEKRSTLAGKQRELKKLTKKRCNPEDKARRCAQKAKQRSCSEFRDREQRLAAKKRTTRDGRRRERCREGKKRRTEYGKKRGRLRLAKKRSTFLGRVKEIMRAKEKRSKPEYKSREKLRDKRRRSTLGAQLRNCVKAAIKRSEPDNREMWRQVKRRSRPEIKQHLNKKRAMRRALPENKSLETERRAKKRSTSQNRLRERRREANKPCRRDNKERARLRDRRKYEKKAIEPIKKLQELLRRSKKDARTRSKPENRPRERLKEAKKYAKKRSTLENRQKQRIREGRKRVTVNGRLRERIREKAKWKRRMHCGVHRERGPEFIKRKQERDAIRKKIRMRNRSGDRHLSDVRHGGRDQLRNKTREPLRRQKKRIHDSEQYATNAVFRNQKIEASLIRKRAKKEERAKKSSALRSARAHRVEVLGREGSWKQAAAQSARHCQQDCGNVLPPSYAALHLQSTLTMISEMYDCLEKVVWATCVVCWRAWFSPPSDFKFSATQKGPRSQSEPWFDLSASVISAGKNKKCVNQWRLELGASIEATLSFLSANYDSAAVQAIRDRLLCEQNGRTVTICKECQMDLGSQEVLPSPAEDMRLCDFVVDPICVSMGSHGHMVAHERWQIGDRAAAVVDPASSHPSASVTAEAPSCSPGIAGCGVPAPSAPVSPDVSQHRCVSGSDEASAHRPETAGLHASIRVLGFSVHEFAPAVAALSDQEEMVLALVHPLVQVYTIPRTGQLAYVGHICNFRQKVEKFLASLPVLPADMPVVQVRPRHHKGHGPGKRPFKVDVQKLRHAFRWLKENNPYYFNVEWQEKAAEAWNAEELQVGSTRDVVDDPTQAPPVSRACFNAWMEHAVNDTGAGESGFSVGKKVLEFIMDEAGPDVELVHDSAGCIDYWNHLRRSVSKAHDVSVFRSANSLPQDILIAALAVRGVLDLGLPGNDTAREMLQHLRTMDMTTCPLDLTLFRVEVDAIMLELLDDDAEVVHVGATSAAAPGDDVGVRQGVVESLGRAAEQVFSSRCVSEDHLSRPCFDHPCGETSLPVNSASPCRPRPSEIECESTPDAVTNRGHVLPILGSQPSPTDQCDGQTGRVCRQHGQGCVSNSLCSTWHSDGNCSFESVPGLTGLSEHGTLPDVDSSLSESQQRSPEGGLESVLDSSSSSKPMLPIVLDKIKHPRVEPPEVDDDLGRAIKEDTPGYIVMAFPKLFPHGTGDYHSHKAGLRRSLSFQEWGRYIMLWHDGRFMRHSRFRYWLLDTMLRVMVPGVQRTFFRTRKAWEDYTLESLMDQKTRRDLVSQMSTCTNMIPGTVGERRRMRQELEAMVHQIEAETADVGMNKGAGRIPSGFCTLTCSVYKWAQLHETVLKGYPSGDSSSPECREYYTKWKELPEGPDREMAMRKAYYQLAVRDPGAVAWYCATKLEMAVSLTAALITHQLQSEDVPGLQDAKDKLAQALSSHIGEDVAVDAIPDLRFFGQVDDYYATYEWSEGGMIHAHMAFWVVGAPRIDKIEVPCDVSKNSEGVEIDVNVPGQRVVPQAQAAEQLAAFWDRAFTEFNVAKPFDADVCQDNSAGMASAIGPRQALGSKKEKEVRSPESISYETLTHCLLNGGKLDEAEESRCWSELVDILAASSRQSREALYAELCEPGIASSETRRARARHIFVSALAEWVNMHDLHRPYSMGPPTKDQRCAHVDDEHSCMERVSCNKLFPRKLVSPGDEEVAEDPRRREMYRLWMARNCHYLNNFVPAVTMAMLSNMDFQATLTKDAVIGYMTKYMTKSGQGALIKVMESNFSACIERAKERSQGTGSAVLRWFNLQSVQEVKSQCECQHLVWNAPRYVSSRCFRHLYLKSDIKVPKSIESIVAEQDPHAPFVERSQAEHYVNRTEWEFPSDERLGKLHPVDGEPLWRFILRRTWEAISDDQDFHFYKPLVEQRWVLFLQLLSWWEVKRLFNRTGKSAILKPTADIVVIHPSLSFVQAKSDSQWVQVCYYTLLAHCNHGIMCSKTFKDAAHLSSFTEEATIELMRLFATASGEERKSAGLAPCPPHISKAWHLGNVRRQALIEKRHRKADVVAAFSSVKYTFHEEPEPWHEKLWADMSRTDQDQALEAWSKSEVRPTPVSEEHIDEDVRALEETQEKLREASLAFMRTQMKWSHKELHDAVVTATIATPSTPSMYNYLLALHNQFGDPQIARLPQSEQSHKKSILRSVLQVMARNGAKLGGKYKDNKPVQAERLAYWINKVFMAGQSADLEDSDESDEHLEFPGERLRPERSILVEHVSTVGEVPQDAVVTPEQAESALGRVVATELDEDISETVDADIKEEEEALSGRLVNPSGVDYSCIAWQPSSPDLVSAASVGWEADRSPRQLVRADFECSEEDISSKLTTALAELGEGFRKQLANQVDGFEVRRQTLDPTQTLCADMIVKWAKQRVDWRQDMLAECGGSGAHSKTHESRFGPKLRLMVLGTAGTGKTYTAKLAIDEVRRQFGSYESVVTMAFSGIAAANLGAGATTIDSIYHTNAAGSEEDLTGQRLDSLWDTLKGVELLVIDEISTCGACALEIVNRRMKQLTCMYWRKVLNRSPPEELPPFGGIGVILMGDFAQLPPVLSSSLMGGMPIVEPKGDGGRMMAIAGRQTFNTFEDVIRFRRIYRQKGVDPFKESTMRLRDSAITLDDYGLWQTHELQVLDPDVPCDWEGGEALSREAVVLVPENAAAGKINGKHLASRAPLHGQPHPSIASRIVVRCEARHEESRGERKRADEFRQLRQAIHLCVGARVMVISNRLWGVTTVPLGLMNGARGVVVAILYALPEDSRVDGCQLAGTGHPSSIPGSFPRGQAMCPLPDYVVVHFPDYKGPALFPDLPKTWVPIPCVDVRHRSQKSLVRAGLPLRLAWALTIHKSQGITAHEGCIVSFDGCRSKAASKLGLAFVAWTRTVSWAKMAFHKLPPVGEFIEARLSHDFIQRSEFEKKADNLFVSTLEKQRISPAALMDAHERHLEKTTRCKEGRPPDAHETADLRTMLSAEGVAPIPDKALAEFEAQSCAKSSGLWSIIASFRAQKKASGKEDRNKKPRKLTVRALVDLGFRSSDATRAVEQSESDWHAMRLILNGMDEKRARYDYCARFKRQVAKGVATVNLDLLAGQFTLQQYEERAREECQREFKAYDLGHLAGKTSGACFWLCLAAGLQECAPAILIRLLSHNDAVSELLENGWRSFISEAVKSTPLGLTAEALRKHFCAGDAAVLIRHDMQELLYAAYVSFDAAGSRACMWCRLD